MPLKVVPSMVKTKTLGLSHSVPFPTRQSVTHLTDIDGTPIYEIKYHVEPELEAWKLRAIAESFEPEDPTQDIEELAWNDLMKRSSSSFKKTSVQPIYGVDAEESLFEDDEPWNMNQFSLDHSIINDFSPEIPKIPGIHSTFVNIGMMSTWFCVHREDSELASVNYLHTGSPKYWYCVPAREKTKLEKLMMKILNPIYKCKTAYLHKCFILHPQLLVKEGIEFTRVIQYPGEMVFTLYGAYHWGFNSGFNVCESSNLASPMYKEIHQRALNCSHKCDFGKGTNATHSKLGELITRWEKR